MTKVNVQEQALSAVLPPVTTAKMNQTAPESNHYRLITTVFPSNHSESNLDDQLTPSQKTNRRRVTRLKKFQIVAQRYKDLIILVLKSIIPDLKTFTWWQAILLILFASFNVIFSVLDFNSLVSKDSDLSLLKWTNDLNYGVPLWRRILLCLSGVAAFTNVLNVVLVIKGKISAYFWGIIGAILYGSFAFAYGYVGDAQLYILFFLPMQFIGMYTWSNQLDQQATARIKSLTWIRWVIVIVLIIGLGVLFFYEIPAFARALTKEYAFDNDIVPHILDASTNAVSFVAQFLLIFCYWEQYILWQCANIIGIFMYSGLLSTGRDINVLMVWIMLSINSVVGLVTWFRRWRQMNKTSVQI